MGGRRRSLTSLKSSRSASTRQISPPNRAARASSKRSVSSALRRFASPVRLSISAWCWTRRCSCAFSSATTACAVSDLAVSICPASNDVGDDHEVAEVGGAGAQREGDPLAGGLGLARAGHLAVAADHDSAGRTRRLDRRLDDHAQQLPRVVSRDERLAEALRGVAHAGALGLDVEALLLELRRHVVERPPELGELIAAAHLDTLAEVAAGDRAGGVRELPQRPDDRLAEQVRDRAEQDERAEQRGADALAPSPARPRRSRAAARARRTTGPAGRRAARWRARGTPSRRRRTRLGDSRAKRQRRARSDADDDRARLDRDEMVARARGPRRAASSSASSITTRIETRPRIRLAADDGHGAHTGRGAGGADHDVRRRRPPRRRRAQTSRRSAGRSWRRSARCSRGSRASCSAWLLAASRRIT